MHTTAPKMSITPAVKKDALEAQIQEQINTLYSKTASIHEKEVAALNYRYLYNTYATLFHALPNHLNGPTEEGE